MDLATQIKTKREAAAQARRLAIAFSREDDRERVLGFAADLERQADELERQMAQGPPPSRTVMQMQTQQAGQVTTDKDPDRKQ